MKRNYSYFIIKPDGVRFLPEITERIEYEFENIRYFKIDEFDSIIKRLYFKHFEEKGEGFAKSFEQYLYGLKSLYGNEAILAIIAEMNEDKKSYLEFCKKVHNAKLEIREGIINTNIGILTNYGRESAQENFVQIIGEDGEKQEQRIFKGKGKYRISDFNIIHCPDPEIETTNQELAILSDSGIVNTQNIIDEKEMEEAKKYRSIFGVKKGIKKEKNQYNQKQEERV